MSIDISLFSIGSLSHHSRIHGFRSFRSRFGFFLNLRSPIDLRFL
jgi:hypothetical protein